MMYTNGDRSNSNHNNNDAPTQPPASSTSLDEDSQHSGDNTTNGSTSSEMMRMHSPHPTATAPTPPPTQPQHYSLGFRGLVVLQLHAPWYTYVAMALLDVYANYATVLAFRYTTITNVTLLDALAIPTAMGLSRCFIQGRRYRCTHLLGVALCLAGITVNVWKDFRNTEDGDSDNDNTNEYPHQLRGDLLSMLGGILFGANNVLGEITLKHYCSDVQEVYGMMSLFAVTIAAVQTALLERQDVADFVGRDESETCRVGTARWLLLAFVASNVVGYMGGAKFLLYSEAAFFNLSLLTGDFWSVAFQIVAERIMPSALFFVAVVLTVSGVLLYELAAPTPDDSDDEKTILDGGGGLEDVVHMPYLHQHDLALELAPQPSRSDEDADENEMAVVVPGAILS